MRSALGHNHIAFRLSGNCFATRDAFARFGPVPSRGGATTILEVGALNRAALEGREELLSHHADGDQPDRSVLRNDLGPRLPGVKPTKRLAATTAFSGNATHCVALTKSGDVDVQLGKWLKVAFNARA